MKTRAATTEELTKFENFIKENHFKLTVELRTTYLEGAAKTNPMLIVGVQEEDKNGDMVEVKE